MGRVIQAFLRAVAATTCVLCGSLAAAQSKVIELQPGEVAPFVQKYPQVVILFTSPDVGCGYCRGADKMFDEAVSTLGKRDWMYARVQWARWKETPQFGPGVEVYGVPDHQIYLQGRFAGGGGGKAANPAALMKSLDDGARRFADNQRANEAQQASFRLHVRERLFETITTTCTELHPGQKQTFDTRFKQWKTDNADALKAANRMKLQAAVRGQDKQFEEAVEQERLSVRQRIQQEMGVDLGKTPSAAQCTQMTSGLAALK
jgi:hypothetical protein